METVDNLFDRVVVNHVTNRVLVFRNPTARDKAKLEPPDSERYPFEVWDMEDFQNYLAYLKRQPV